ncbi:MAG: hypothetical protein LC112_13970 [Flavobacteriales bacterium]|nr:hypothetical protein [Flavobacteriales bacterium]
MDELFIYDRDKGLFKEILKQSFVIEGRYHVSADGGMDLNTNNLNTLIAKIPEQKYPLCVCMTPRSQIIMQNGQQREEFYFNLLFLCQTYIASNGVKRPDGSTRKSTHEVWYDWKDMKQCAQDFLLMLDKVIREKKIDGIRPIGVEFNVDISNVAVRRLSKYSEDRVSGVLVTFVGNMNGGQCEITDYPNEAFSNITVPDLVVHPQHKH